MSTVQEFIKKHMLEMKSQPVYENPNMDSEREMDHFQVCIRSHELNPDGKKIKTGEFVTYFSMGIGHRKLMLVQKHPGAEPIQENRCLGPELHDVLDCIASDCAGVENATSFEDWANDYGYDDDSRKTKKTFKICEVQAKKFKAFLGDDAYNELLWDTDRPQ